MPLLCYYNRSFFTSRMPSPAGFDSIIGAGGGGSSCKSISFTGFSTFLRALRDCEDGWIYYSNAYWTLGTFPRNSASSWSLAVSPPSSSSSFLSVGASLSSYRNLGFDDCGLYFFLSFLKPGDSCSSFSISDKKFFLNMSLFPTGSDRSPLISSKSRSPALKKFWAV